MANGPSFNSEMVRLKEGTEIDIVESKNSFQFRNGSIKRSAANAATTDFMRFNSEMVRLKVGSDQGHYGGYTRFNSEMVRLKEQDDRYMGL